LKQWVVVVVVVGKGVGSMLQCHSGRGDAAYIPVDEGPVARK
jgi:hypothetical protein